MLSLALSPWFLMDSYWPNTRPAKHLLRYKVLVGVHEAAWLQLWMQIMYMNPASVSRQFGNIELYISCSFSPCPRILSSSLLAEISNLLLLSAHLAWRFNFLCYHTAHAVEAEASKGGVDGEDGSFFGSKSRILVSILWKESSWIQCKKHSKVTIEMKHGP